MLQQICLDYSSLPDVRSLKLHEILFFYEGIRGQLRANTKPRPKK